jgi:hypothetical protein
MLRRPRDEAAAEAEQREIDRLGPGRDESDLCSLRAERFGREVTRPVESCARGTAFGVWARGVARRCIAKRGDNLGEDRRRAGVVQVDAGRQGVCWWMSSLSVPW